MPITLHCPCGKTLQVDEKYRGKKAKCPACNGVLVVEEPAGDFAPAAVTIDAPAPAPRTIEASAPAPAAPANPFAVPTGPTKTRPRRRSMTPWFAGAGCGLIFLFSCCAGIGFSLWYFLLRGPDDDLRFVHAEVTGFYSLRIGDLLKSQAVKDELGRLPVAEKKKFDAKLVEMEKKLGLSLADVERATFITRSVDPRDSGMVLRTSKPMSRKKIFATLSSDKTEKKHGDRTYYVLERGGNVSMVLHFASDTIVLKTENEKAMQDFLANADKPTADPVLKRGVKYASSGSYPVVAAFKVTRPMINQMLAGEAPNAADMTGLVVTATVDQRLSFEAAAVFPDGAIASRAKGDFDAFRQRFEREARRPAHGDAAFFANILGTLTIDQRGAEVVARGKADVPVNPLLAMVRTVDLKSPGQDESRKNLDKIARAIRTYEAIHGKLPDRFGKAGLSWRVAILPYLDNNDALFKQIDIDEPWDSKHNSKLWSKMPKVFQLPGKSSSDSTYYQVFSDHTTAFPDGKGNPPLRFGDISDGIDQTIFVVEAAEAVNWMKPADIAVKPNLLKSVGNHWGDDTFQAAFGDGAIRRLPRSIQHATLHAMVTRAGRENVDARKFDENDAPDRPGDDEP